MKNLQAAFRQTLPSSGCATVIMLTLVLGIGAHPASGAVSQNWPRFRGPNGSGTSESRNLPVEFGPTNNLAWRTAVPAGHSSPVVWENRVFLTGYDDSRGMVL